MIASFPSYGVLEPPFYSETDIHYFELVNECICGFFGGGAACKTHHPDIFETTSSWQVI